VGKPGHEILSIVLNLCVEIVGDGQDDSRRFGCRFLAMCVARLCKPCCTG
jgi:hypothetical protein